MKIYYKSKYNTTVSLVIIYLVSSVMLSCSSSKSTVYKEDSGIQKPLVSNSSTTSDYYTQYFSQKAYQNQAILDNLQQNETAQDTNDQITDPTTLQLSKTDITNTQEELFTNVNDYHSSNTINAKQYQQYENPNLTDNTRFSDGSSDRIIVQNYYGGYYDNFYNPNLYWNNWNAYNNWYYANPFYQSWGWRNRTWGWGNGVVYSNWGWNHPWGWNAYNSWGFNNFYNRPRNYVTRRAAIQPRSFYSKRYQSRTQNTNTRNRNTYNRSIRTKNYQNNRNNYNTRNRRISTYNGNRSRYRSNTTTSPKSYNGNRSRVRSYNNTSRSRGISRSTTSRNRSRGINNSGSRSRRY